MCNIDNTSAGQSVLLTMLTVTSGMLHFSWQSAVIVVSIAEVLSHVLIDTGAWLMFLGPVICKLLVCHILSFVMLTEQVRLILTSHSARSWHRSLKPHCAYETITPLSRCRAGKESKVGRMCAEYATNEIANARDTVLMVTGCPFCRVPFTARVALESYFLSFAHKNCIVVAVSLALIKQLSASVLVFGEFL